MTAAAGKFAVGTDGSIYGADGKFGVDSVGNVTTAGNADITGSLTAADGQFQVWSENGGFSAAGGDFVVHSDGTVIAKAGIIAAGGGEFRGAVKAPAGHFTEQITVDGKNGDSAFYVNNEGYMQVGNGNFKVHTDGTIKAKNGVFDGIVTGLTNKNWNGTTYTSGRAATEDQLFVVQGNVDDLEQKTDHIKHVTEPEGTDYTEVEGTKFYSDGSMNIANGKFTVDTEGNTEVKGWMVIQGKTTINADATVQGNLKAGTIQNANESFKVDKNGKISADTADIGGVIIEDKGIKAGVVQINMGSATDSRVLDINDGNFTVFNSGAFKAADENFVVTKEGNTTANSYTTGTVKINTKGDNTITGLSNTEWNDETPVVNNRAATEGQLSVVQEYVDINSDALDAYKAAGIVAGNEVGQYFKAIALGDNATANGWSAVAFGSNANAVGSNSVAIGVNSASDELSTAVGAGSTAIGAQATALGQNSKASDQGAVSLGANSEAVGDGAVSIGFNNSAEVAGSVAIGNGAHVYEGGTNSVALGQWSQASDDRVVSVGNDWLKRRITNVAAGTDPTDAVNVQQLTDRTAHMVEWDEGTKDTIHGVTLNGGTISAADDKFNVWSSGGMEAIYGKFDGNIEAAGGNFKVNGTTGGITTAGGIEAASGITAANDKFHVWNSGGMEAAYGVFEGKITAAGEKFIVDGNGNITTAGQITAANNKFHVWGTGGIAIGVDTANPLFAVNGNNGDVTTQGEIVAKGMYVGSKDDDNAVVTKGDMTDVVGNADFSHTNYAKDANNVTKAIEYVDDQVKANSTALDAYEEAGITAGSVDEGAKGVIAMGDGASVTNANGRNVNNAIAIGTSATAGRNNAVAIGLESNAAGENSVALGYKAQTTANRGYNSVALGYGSIADQPMVVSVGNANENGQRRIVNVAAGTGDFDAVNVAQLKSAVSDATEGKGMVTWDPATDGSGTYKEGTINGVTLNNSAVTANELEVGNVDGKAAFDVGTNGEFNAVGGKFAVNAYGGFGAVQGEDGHYKFHVGEDGDIKALNGGFLVNKEGINLNKAFTVSTDGAVTASGGIHAAQNAFQVDSLGNVTAKEVTITIDNSNSVNMSDMWKIMSGPAGFTVGNTTYGGAYFTKSNGTAYLNYGSTSNINLNNLGTVMDAMDGKIQSVVDKINELPNDAANNSTTTATQSAKMTAKAAAAETAAAPAANNGLATPEVAQPMAPSVMTMALQPNLLSETGDETQTETGSALEREPGAGDTAEGGADSKPKDAILVNENKGNGFIAHADGTNTIKGQTNFEDGLNVGSADKPADSSFHGDVAIGNSDTNYDLTVNGENVMDKIHANEATLEQHSTAISTLGSKVGELDSRIDEVGAGAAALAALHPLDFDPDNKWDFSAGYGNYRGESAVAFGAFYRPNEDTMFSVGGTVGNDDNMVNAGVSLKIGSGSSGVTTSRVAMAKEIKAMRDVVAKQDAQIQKLTAMVNALVGVQSEPDTTTMFPDVPENHWAYEAVAAMARSGLVKGYPDGEFKGDRTMTRYEFAQIIQNAIQAGAEVDSRLVEEFKPELEYFHIATVAKDKDGNPTIERVRAN